MTASTRFLRSLTSLGMGAGTAVILLVLLDLLRGSVSGPLADLIPNLPLPPAALLVGTATIALSAVTRRRAIGRHALTSPRPDEELKPTATPGSLVE
jgi:hypothetical protein